MGFFSLRTLPCKWQYSGGTEKVVAIAETPGERRINSLGMYEVQRMLEEVWFATLSLTKIHKRILLLFYVSVTILVTKLRYNPPHFRLETANIVQLSLV